MYIKTKRKNVLRALLNRDKQLRIPVDMVKRICMNEIQVVRTCLKRL